MGGARGGGWEGGECAAGAHRVRAVRALRELTVEVRVQRSRRRRAAQLIASDRCGDRACLRPPPVLGGGERHRDERLDQEGDSHIRLHRYQGIPLLVVMCYVVQLHGSLHFCKDDVNLPTDRRNKDKVQRLPHIGG